MIRPAAWSSRGSSNAPGLLMNDQSLTGQMTTKTFPTTSLAGMKPPPGSPMWARESTDWLRLSPITQMWSSGTGGAVQLPWQACFGSVT